MNNKTNTQKKEMYLMLKEISEYVLNEKSPDIQEKKTLNDFFEDYIRERPLKESTKANYKYMYKNYVYDTLGRKNLTQIKYSDIKRLYNSLIEEKGFKPCSMEVINNILHPIFDIAVRDDVIAKNPAKGVMAEIKSRNDWGRSKRFALTEEEQKIFINYVSRSPIYHRWLPVFIVLLGTGCRVGEVIGLRWQDCDFENKIISINHNLTYRLCDNGKVEFHITTPKTAAGIRIIPMFDEVCRILLKEYKIQRREGFNETVIDGYDGFIFKNRYGGVFSSHAINRGIKRIYEEYNKTEIQNAEEEDRKPNLLPHFTAHNLRHTFCSRMCENESNQVNLKVIQEIMGHSSIDTTLDVYTDLTTKIKKDAFKSLQGKIKLS